MITAIILGLFVLFLIYSIVFWVKADHHFPEREDFIGRVKQESIDNPFTLCSDESFLHGSVMYYNGRSVVGDIVPCQKCKSKKGCVHCGYKGYDIG